jgi:hypothetical protein
MASLPAPALTPQSVLDKLKQAVSFLSNQQSEWSQLESALSPADFTDAEIIIRNELVRFIKERLLDLKDAEPDLSKPPNGEPHGDVEQAFLRNVFGKCEALTAAAIHFTALSRFALLRRSTTGGVN